MKWHTVASVAMSIRLTVPLQEQVSTWNDKTGLKHHQSQQLIIAPKGNSCSLVGIRVMSADTEYRGQDRLELAWGRAALLDQTKCSSSLYNSQPDALEMPTNSV